MLKLCLYALLCAVLVSGSALVGQADVPTITADTANELFDFVTLRPQVGDPDEFYDVALTDDATLVAGGDASGRVFIWDVESSEQVAALNAHDEFVSAVLFSPDGSLLASSGSTGEIIIWDVATGSALSTFDAHFDYAVPRLFSADGSQLVTTGFDNQVITWDLATGAVVDSQMVDSFALVTTNPDGGRIIALSSQTGSVPIIPPDDDPLVVGRDGDYTEPITFSPDASLIATVDAETVRVYAWAESGTPLLEVPLNVNGLVEFNHDGTLLASGARNGDVLIWDIETGVRIAALAGHFRTSDGLDFSADGRRLASAGHDGQVIVWGFFDF